MADIVIEGGKVCGLCMGRLGDQRARTAAQHRRTGTFHGLPSWSEVGSVCGISPADLGPRVKIRRARTISE